MALKGSAFIFMWHDIAPSRHGEYLEWHTREHMIERLSIPGFLVGKRLQALQTGRKVERHVFGTIYAGEDVEVFRSPAYLERLNHPTPWTSAVAPSFQNMLRVACERIASAGTGDGGSMATLRFVFSQPDATAAAQVLKAKAQDLVQAIQALSGVACAHLGLARSDVSGVRTRETELRGDTGEKMFDAVLLVEGFYSAGLQAALPQVQELALATNTLADPITRLYDVEYALDSTQLPAQYPNPEQA